MNILFRARNLHPVPSLVNIYQILRFRHKHGPKQRKEAEACAGKSKPLIQFNCKVALITGGAEGIGLAIANQLLTENVQNVALIGINNSAGRDAVNILNCTYGKNKAIFFNCDVQSQMQVTECYTKVTKEFGKVDIIVNSAGISDGCNWEKEIMTNLVGTVHNLLQGYKIMSKQNGGCGGVILNISGLHGVEPLYVAPTLSASYYGIIGLSRSFGDYRHSYKSGIRVVTLCPGITNTNFIKDLEKKTLTPEMGKEMEAFLSKVKRQNTDVCGKAGLHVLKYGSSGSVWVVEASKLYSLNIPTWKKYRILESQLI